MLTLAKELWFAIAMTVLLGLQAASSGDQWPALLFGILLGCLLFVFADAWESRREGEIDA